MQAVDRVGVQGIRGAAPFHSGLGIVFLPRTHTGSARWQNPSVHYARWQPSAEVAALVEHYWVVEAPAATSTVRAVLVPNGRATIQFSLGAPGVRVDRLGARHVNADVFLPAQPGPVLLEQDGASHYVGVQFAPWGARQIWPSAPKEPTSISRLTSVRPAADDLRSHPVESLDYWLSGLLPAEGGDLGLIRRCIAAIDADPAEAAVHQLSGRVGTSGSSIYRAFVKHVGLTPKQYIDVMRHRAFTDALLPEEAATAAATVAAAAGYFDQSHAIRAFRRYTGMSPRQFKGDYDGIARLLAD